VIQKCELVEKRRRIWRNSWWMGPTATVSFEQQAPAANTAGFASSLVIAPEKENGAWGQWPQSHSNSGLLLPTPLNLHRYQSSRQSPST